VALNNVVVKHHFVPSAHGAQYKVLESVNGIVGVTPTDKRVWYVTFSHVVSCKDGVVRDSVCLAGLPSSAKNLQSKGYAQGNH
jgi:hypothetical protein